jgi:GxxExxY protein
MAELWIHGDLVHSIVGAFYDVYNYYKGHGLNERIYTGALEYELIDRGHQVVRELAVPVSYKGRHVARQRLDMVVDGTVIVESKASERLSPAARAQSQSYLRATPFEVGLLLHFGPEPKFYRFIDFPRRIVGSPITHASRDSSDSPNSSDSSSNELGSPGREEAQESEEP